MPSGNTGPQAKPIDLSTEYRNSDVGKAARQMANSGSFASDQRRKSPAYSGKNEKK